MHTRNKQIATNCHSIRRAGATMSMIPLVVGLLIAGDGAAQSPPPCAPGTECLRVTAKGEVDPHGQYIAQCNKQFPVFPDFIVAEGLFPGGYEGPWFQMSQDYPAELSVGESAPWLEIEFWKDVEQANRYLYALRDYAFEGNIEVDFRVQENPVRPWYTMPYMNYGSHPREFVHGVTEERPLAAPELGIWEGIPPVRNFAIGFYNAPGGHSIGNVWRDPMSPNLEASQFPEGTMVFKILFSAATPADFQDPSSYILKEAPEWEIAMGDRTATGDRTLTTVRLLQMDVAARDTRARDTGWVFGTFAFDRYATDEVAWNRLRPVGLMWGNDPGYTPDDQEQGRKLTEGIVSDQIPPYAKDHLGWAGRVNGPVDNPISACSSCHGTAQYPVAANLGPFGKSCEPVEKRLHWFRNIAPDEAFGAVNRRTCMPEARLPPPQPLGYSLQMMVAVSNIRDSAAQNPCLPPPLALSAESLQDAAEPGEPAPFVTRNGLIDP